MIQHSFNIFYVELFSSACVKHISKFSKVDGSCKMSTALSTGAVDITQQQFIVDEATGSFLDMTFFSKMMSS